MLLRSLILAGLSVLAPLAAAEAAPRPAPDLATLATTQPAAYAAHRRYHRHHRRSHAHRSPYLLTSHPRWPRCYDRAPFYCPPEEELSVVRYHRDAPLRVRG